MLVVSTREFRQNQKNYLDQIDSGMELLLQRGHNKYKILPITEDDTVISEEYILMPDEDLARAITMSELLVGVKEDLRAIFKKEKK